MADYVIRTYRPADVPDLGEIVAQAWAPFFEMLQARMGPDLFGWVRGDDWRAAKLAEVTGLCDEHPEWCLVAEADGRAVGFVTFVIFSHRPLGEISNNSVLPAYQGRGLATALYQRVLEIFREHGLKCAKVVTGTDEPFAAARAAYEKVGFRPILPHVEYYLPLAEEEEA